MTFRTWARLMKPGDIKEHGNNMSEYMDILKCSESLRLFNLAAKSFDDLYKFQYLKKKEEIKNE